MDTRREKESIQKAHDLLYAFKIENQEKINFILKNSNNRSYIATLALHELLQERVWSSSILLAIKLIEKGANPNLVDAKWNTLLHLAASKAWGKYIPTLLNYHIYPNQVNKAGETALGLLLEYDYFELEAALLLLKHNADPQTTNAKGNTLLHIAVLKGYWHEHVETLCQFHVDVNVKNKKGETALSLLMNREYFNFNVALTLLDYGADPTVQDAQGNNLLHLATQKPYKFRQYISKLIEFKVPINTFNHQDETPLFLLSFDNSFLLNRRNILALITNGGYPEDTFLDKHFWNGMKDPELFVKQMTKKIIESFDDYIQIILSCFNQGFPKWNHYFHKHIVPKIIMKHPTIQFKNKNLSDLKLSLKYLTAMHEARRDILHFLIMLAVSQRSKTSYFSILPPELLGHILFFMDLDTAKKSLSEVTQLMTFLFDHIQEVADQIKSFSNFAGFSVLQKKNGGSTHQFVFFQSSEHVCVNFHSSIKQYKNELKKNQKRKNLFYDWVVGKKYTNTSLQKISQRETNIYDTYRQCLDRQFTLFHSEADKRHLLMQTESTTLGKKF